MKGIVEFDKKLLGTIHRLFDTQGTGTLAESKHLLISLVLYAFALAHLAFFLFFSYTNISELVAFNLFSISFYAAIILADRRRLLTADAILVLIIAEVCAHAILSTYMVGWAAGFAIYPLVVSALIVSFSGRSLLLPLMALATFMATILACDLLFYQRAPIYALDSAILNISRRTNYAFALIALATAALFYHFLLSRVDHSLQQMAEEDQLTGLHNRRALEKYAQESIITCHSLRAPVCIAIGDIDHFKRVNDTYGHAAGDALLVATANTLSRQQRNTDIVARWGGEEFAWVLGNTSLSNAKLGMDRIRREIEAIEIEFDDSTLKATMTIGVTEVLPGERLSDAIDRADNALYEGKKSGRNQVNVARQGREEHLQQV